MSSSNCCFPTCIQISQEAGQVVWYSHLLKNFPVCCVPHKGFGIVNKAEIDVFLEFSCFFHDPVDVGSLISGSSAFSKTSLSNFGWPLKLIADITACRNLPLITGHGFPLLLCRPSTLCHLHSMNHSVRCLSLSYPPPSLEVKTYITVSGLLAFYPKDLT